MFVPRGDTIPSLRLMAQTIQLHPYFPRDVIVPGYHENTTPLAVTLGAFGLLVGIVLVTALILAKRANHMLSVPDQFATCWFVLSGFLHCFFEGYFVLNHAHVANSQVLFAQVWKEYALSDSRYVRSDPFMLCIEGITALVWGPLCFIIAVCIVRKSSLRYPLETIMCVGHLYGVALYYGTCHYEYMFHGISHSRPEFLYYWVYYMGFNLPWATVPVLLLANDIREVRRAFRALDKIDLLLHQESKLVEPKKTK